MTEYSTGWMNFKANITSEKEVTIDFIVNEATTIWETAKSRKLKIDDVSATENLMTELRRKHPEFCKSYPIVFRYICQMQEYSTKAFGLWLKKIKNSPWKNEMEYLDAQADYVVILFKTKYPKRNKTEVANLRKNIRTILQNEHSTFKTYTEEFEKEVSAEETFWKIKNFNELKDFSIKAGHTFDLAETIKVITDLPGKKTEDLLKDSSKDSSKVKTENIEKIDFMSVDQLLNC